MTAFRPSRGFTVGIEEELLLVDPETLALAPAAPAVLAALDAGDGAGHEIYAATIELRSRPCETVEEAVAQLAELRARSLRAGGTLLAAGVHPDGAFGDAEHVDLDRYRLVGEKMRGFVHRTPECALHVHVGMPDLDTAVRVLNGLRARIPLLQGLAAASPFWFGRDSGFASARGALVRPYPGRGIPRTLRDAADWEELVGEVLAVAELDDPTFLWSDVRINPRHGTIELRELDAQASLDHAAALAALVRALAVEAAAAPPPPAVAGEALDWSSFRALRDGVDARILDGGELRALGEVTSEAAARLGAVADELGDRAALSGIARLLASGGGAGLQRRAFAEGGMRRLLEHLVEQTAGRRPSGTDSEPDAASIVRRWLDARASCDLETLSRLTAPDAVWESPVAGTVRGRDALLDQVRSGFADTEAFASEVRSLEVRGDRAAAVIRNTGRRNGKQLDSLQTLFLRVDGRHLGSVRVAVDDPDAIERFWED